LSVIISPRTTTCRPSRRLVPQLQVCLELIADPSAFCYRCCHCCHLSLPQHDANNYLPHGSSVEENWGRPLSNPHAVRKQRCEWPKTNTWINMDWATCANIIYPSKKAQHPRALLFFPDRFLFPTTTARLPNSSTQTFCRLESPIRHSEWPLARKTLASRPSRSTSPARCVSSCPEHVLADVRPLPPFDTARLGSFFF
jgi:hypothetical protein